MQKIGWIRPIYKGKGSKDDPTNYRPISVISHISKIIEKIVKTQLVNLLSLAPTMRFLPCVGCVSTESILAQ